MGFSALMIFVFCFLFVMHMPMYRFVSLMGKISLESYF